MINVTKNTDKEINFTTKGVSFQALKDGRINEGGTYNIRLYVENYKHDDCSFFSDEAGRKYVDFNFYCAFDAAEISSNFYNYCRHND